MKEVEILLKLSSSNVTSAEPFILSLIRISFSAVKLSQSMIVDAVLFIDGFALSTMQR